MRLHRAAAVAGLALGLMSGAAHASYIVTFTQSVDGVTAKGVGEFNTDLLDKFAISNVQPGINPSDGYFGFTPDPTKEPDILKYQGVFTGASSYGSGGYSQPDISMGEAAFSYQLQSIFVPTDYVSGTLLTDSMTFSGATFSSLGLTPGTYTYTYGDQASSSAALTTDTIQIVVSRGVPTVPLPASAPLFGAALLALGAVGYGMKRKPKTA